MREIIKENKVCEKDEQSSLSEDAITWGGVVFFYSERFVIQIYVFYKTKTQNVNFDL